MFERDVHASNADHSISTNPSFSSTSFNDEHPLNNPSYIISIFLGNITLSSEVQFVNTLLLKNQTLSGITTALKLVQSEKAPPSTIFKPSGRDNSSKDLQCLNAPEPISSTPISILALFKFSHP